MFEVQLAAFDPASDLPVVTDWLHLPHVARWWGDPAASLYSVQRHDPAVARMIKVDGRPVGYICWQKLSPEERELADLSELPADMVDIDIFIGDAELLGHGIGSITLGRIPSELHGAGLRVVGIAAAIANKRAFRAYEKVGFRPYSNFREAGEDFRYLVSISGEPGIDDNTPLHFRRGRPRRRRAT